MKTSSAALAVAALLTAAPAFAADVETFFGWSKDGTWFAWQKVSGPIDLTELNFCATDENTPPSWPDTLNDAERTKVDRHSCVVYTDPNRAPFGWKAKLAVPRPSFVHGKMRVLTELVPDGENPGFVVEEKEAKDKEKKTVCYVTGLRESSKLQQVWWHASGRWVAAQVDGRFTHCNQPLKPLEPQKAEKPKKGGKK
jgi:hypothetical protein